MTKSPKPNRVTSGSTPGNRKFLKIPLEDGPMPGVVLPTAKLQDFLTFVDHCSKEGKAILLTCHKAADSNEFVFEMTELKLPRSFSTRSQQADFYEYMEGSAKVFDQLNGLGRRPRF